MCESQQVKKKKHFSAVNGINAYEQQQNKLHFNFHVCTYRLLSVFQKEQKENDCICDRRTNRFKNEMQNWWKQINDICYFEKLCELFFFLDKNGVGLDWHTIWWFLFVSLYLTFKKLKSSYLIFNEIWTFFINTFLKKRKLIEI